MDVEQSNDSEVKKLHCTPAKLITDLDDDCLECIFTRAQDLLNEIHIAKSCKRFENVMMGLWKRQPTRKILDYNALWSALMDYKDFKFFITAMRKEFNTLLLIDECLNSFLKEMKDTGIECFSGIVRCIFNDNITDCYPHDDDVESLSRLVPNLRYLEITVPISGKHLVNFQHLEELHLYDEQTKSKEIAPEALKEILLNLKHLRVLDIRTFEFSNLELIPEISQCLTLEVLKLNVNTLRPVVDHVIKLPQLKQLKVLLDQVIDVSVIENVDNFDYRIHRTQEYYRILHEKGMDIKGVAVDFKFLPVESTWTTDFGYLQPENLLILALCNNRFFSNDYEKYKFSRLEILCLRHTCNLQTQDIMNMLQLCPVLKHLDVSYCLNLNTSLLRALCKFMEKEKRPYSLCLYYRLSGLENEIDKNRSFWTKQNFIKLENGFPPDSDNGLSYVQRGYAFYF